MQLTRWTPWWLACLLLISPTTIRANDHSPRVDFNRQIRPILSESCYQCHGPDRNKRKADLQARPAATACSGRPTARRSSFPASPTRANCSSRITDRRPGAPHAAAQERRTALTAEQIDLIKRWIAEGAEWKGHWAYLPPTRPAVPAGRRPRLPASDIDRFILRPARAEQRLEPLAGGRSGRP